MIKQIYLLLEDVLFILIMLMDKPNMISNKTTQLSLRHLKICQMKLVMNCDSIYQKDSDVK